jgi:hypothetical protein
VGGADHNGVSMLVSSFRRKSEHLEGFLESNLQPVIGSAEVFLQDQ